MLDVCSSVVPGPYIYRSWFSSDVIRWFDLYCSSACVGVWLSDCENSLDTLLHNTSSKSKTFIWSFVCAYPFSCSDSAMRNILYWIWNHTSVVHAVTSNVISVFCLPRESRLSCLALCLSHSFLTFAHPHTHTYIWCVSFPLMSITGKTMLWLRLAINPKTNLVSFSDSFIHFRVFF